MPRLVDAIAANVARLSRPGVSQARFAPPDAGFPPTPMIGGPAGLPIRGTFPAGSIFDNDFFVGSMQYRFAQRSSTPIPAAAVTTSRTPVALVNKRLVAPTIGGGTKLSRYNVISTTVSPTAVGAGVTVTQLFTATGVQAADKLIGFEWKTPQAKGVTVLAVRVNAANQIAVDFSNPTGGSLTPTGGTIILFLVQ